MAASLRRWLLDADLLLEDTAHQAHDGRRLVRQSFRSLHDMLSGEGCDSREESGPGRVYRLRGTVDLHSRPKQHWLGLGFPESMRQDVRTSTGTVRPQQHRAWFNWGPDSCDRRTIEVLIRRSLSRAS